MALDLLDRPLNLGDYVVFHNCIYRVHALPKSDRDHAQVAIMLLNPSKTTRPVKKYSSEMCLIPKEDVTAWILKTS